MNLKTQAFLIAAFILFLLVSGCITSCIPTKVDAKYIDENGEKPVVIIGGHPFLTYKNTYEKIRVNQTQSLAFEVIPQNGETLIHHVCER